MMNKFFPLNLFLVLTTLLVSSTSMADDDFQCTIGKFQMIKPALRADPRYQMKTEGYSIIETYGNRKIEKVEIDHGGCEHFYISISTFYVEVSPSNELVLSDAIAILKTVQPWVDYNMLGEILKRLEQAQKEGNFVIGEEMIMMADYDSVAIELSPSNKHPKTLSIVYRAIP